MHKYFSTQRMSTYNSSDNYKDYIDNIKASMHAYPMLHTMEITLRNRIDSVLQSYYGSNWAVDCFHRRSSLNLHASMKGMICAAVKKIPKAKKASPLNEDIVANLTFGFWVGCFHKDFLKANNRKLPTADWLIKVVIETIPPKLQLHQIQQKAQTHYKHLEELNSFRNRVYHYENITHNKTLPLNKMKNSLIKYINLFERPTDELSGFLDRCTTYQVDIRILS